MAIALVVIAVGILFIKMGIPIQPSQQTTITSTATSAVSSTTLTSITTAITTTINFTKLPDNTFFVIYLHNKPNLTIYNEISNVFSRAIASNSSNTINITFNVNLMKYSDLPMQLKQYLNNYNYTVYPVMGIVSSKIDKNRVKIVSLIFNEINGIYIVKREVLNYLYYHWGLESIGEKIVIETNVMPSHEIDYTPIYGSPNSRFYLFIYEDMYCPYCAKFYVETFPKIGDLIDRGVLAIIHKNLVVHSNVEPIHRYLLAAYLESKNSSGLFKVIKTLYKQVYDYSLKNHFAGLPDMERVRNVVREVLGVEPNVAQYNGTISKILLKDSSEAVESYWIYGTPGFVLWDREKGYGIIFVGFRSSNDIVNIIDFLNK